MNKRAYFNNTDIFFDAGVPIFINRFHENNTSALHTHDYLEINYIAEGKGFHFIDDDVIPVTSGDIFIIPVGTAHVFRAESVESGNFPIVYNCVFPADQLKEWCGTMPLPFNAGLVFSRSDRSYYHYHDSQHEARSIFERLHKEFLQQRPGYRTLLITEVIELLILLHRFEIGSYELTASSNRLDPVFEFIQMNCQEPLSAEQAANMVYMSPSHFQRLFKKATDQTFLEYLQNVRIEKSCTLLRTTSLKVHEISHRIGYYDVQFFHRLFKKKMGVTPCSYRNIAATFGPR